MAPEAAGQTVINGSRRFLGTVDLSDTHAVLIPPSSVTDPSGVCLNSGEMKFSISSGAWFRCTNGTWSKQAASSGSGYAYDRPFVLDRLYQMVLYNNTKTNATPSYQRIFMDPATTATPGYADAYGDRRSTYVDTGYNLQLGGKTTSHAYHWDSQHDAGQGAFMGIVSTKIGTGDHSIFDVVFDYLNAGNTPGDEGGNIGRFQVMNSGARTQTTVGSVDPASTCTATLVTDVITPQPDFSGSPNGKQALTVHVNSTSGCQVGEVLHIDAPPNFALAGVAQNHWCDATRTGQQETCPNGTAYVEEEFVQLTAVNTAANTITARFFASHLANAPVRTTTVIRPSFPGDFNKAGTKMLVVNTEASKQYNAGTVSSTGNSNVFRLVGGTWSASMFGGNASLPGAAIAPTDDRSGNGQDDSHWDAWQEVASLSASQATIRALSHYNEITASQYKLAPATSVETRLLDGTGNVSGLVLRNQPWDNTHKLATGDHIEIAADPSGANPNFMNVLFFQNFPFGAAGGLNFRNKGRGVASGLGFSTDAMYYANGKPRPAFNGFFSANDAAVPYYTGIAVDLTSRAISSPSRGYGPGMSVIVLKSYAADSIDGADPKNLEWVTNASGRRFLLGQNPTSGDLCWGYDGSGYYGGCFKSGDWSYQVHNKMRVSTPSGAVAFLIKVGQRNGAGDGNSTDQTAIDLTAADSSNTNVDINVTPKGTGVSAMTNPRLVPQSTDPGCTTARIGLIWIDNSASTTAFKVCLAVSGTAGWVTK